MAYKQNPTPEEQQTYRNVLEIGINQLNKSKDMIQCKKIWDSFPVLQGDWRFITIKNTVKNQLS